LANAQWAVCPALLSKGIKYNDKIIIIIIIIINKRKGTA
jgi:hypothetical protein